MKKFSFLCVLVLTGCSTHKLTVPKTEKAPALIQGLGEVEIERGANNRGANLGSFASLVQVSPSDFLVGTIGGSFGRFNTQNGSFKWKKTYKVGVASRPIVEGDRVFVGALDGFVYCYSLSKGEELWRKKLSSESLGNLVYGASKLYVATADNVLWALNAESGQELWTLRRPSPVATFYWSLRGNTAGVLSADGSKLYLGFSDGVLLALHSATGETIWERSFNRKGRFQDADTEPVLSPDGSTLYVVLPDFSIQMIKASDGSSVDSFPDASGFLPLIDFKEGSIVYSTQNGSVRKYDLSTKKLLWEFSLDQKGLAGDIVEFKKGVGMFVSTRYGVHLIDLKKGTLIEEKYLGEGIVARPFSDGQRIFILSGRGRMIFLRYQN
jgi:outer membrane protein assembly factor BamB